MELIKTITLGRGQKLKKQLSRSHLKKVEIENYQQQNDEAVELLDSEKIDLFEFSNKLSSIAIDIQKDLVNNIE